MRLRDLYGPVRIRGRDGARAFAAGGLGIDKIRTLCGDRISVARLSRMRTGMTEKASWPTIEEARMIAEAIEVDVMVLLEELAAARLRWHKHCIETRKENARVDPPVSGETRP